MSNLEKLTFLYKRLTGKSQYQINIPQASNSLRSAPDITIVGVGPGDPSLLTLAAVQAIQNATLVAYPISQEEKEGMAAKIASFWITDKKKRMPLLFPMVSEAAPRKDAWRKATDHLLAAASEGEKVVFLCQGDASLFASGAYLSLDLKSRYPDCKVKIIPGITSISAAAAVGDWPLALQQEQLLILPTPDDPSRLEALLDEAAYSKRILALLKLGHRWLWVKPLLERMDLLESALFAEKVGLEDQQIKNAIEVSKSERPYFSLLLIRQSWPEVIP